MMRKSRTDALVLGMQLGIYLTLMLRFLSDPSTIKPGLFHSISIAFGFIMMPFVIGLSYDAARRADRAESEELAALKKFRRDSERKPLSSSKEIIDVTAGQSADGESRSLPSIGSDVSHDDEHVD